MTANMPDAPRRKPARAVGERSSRRGTRPMLAARLRSAAVVAARHAARAGSGRRRAAYSPRRARPRARHASHTGRARRRAAYRCGVLSRRLVVVLLVAGAFALLGRD